MNKAVKIVVRRRYRAPPPARVLRLGTRAALERELAGLVDHEQMADKLIRELQERIEAVRKTQAANRRRQAEIRAQLAKK